MSANTLAQQKEGTFVCRALSADGEALLRLKRFGICQDRLISVVRSGDPMIVMSAGGQFAISRQLAQHVKVSAAGTVPETSA